MALKKCKECGESISKKAPLAQNAATLPLKKRH